MHDPLKAAADLADVLTLENAALRRLDFPAAANLLPAKRAALEALSAAGAISQPLPATATSLGRRLMTLAAENRALLERAMAVQSRILGIVARASRSASNQGYGPKGQYPSPRQGAAVALSTNA
ncbi:MAG TPA: hypothetical protein VHC04_21525 [Rhodopila sp.]|nr:hypothetical protein [Rhodopila sp.]